MFGLSPDEFLPIPQRNILPKFAMHEKNQRRPRHQQSKRPFWFDLGRILFPDLINHPRAMKVRVLVVTIGMAALLVGTLVGFYRQANNPADILLIQARELRK